MGLSKSRTVASGPVGPALRQPSGKHTSNANAHTQPKLGKAPCRGVGPDRPRVVLCRVSLIIGEQPIA